MKKVIIFLMFFVLALNINSKNWDSLSPQEQRKYLEAKQQLGSYVAAFGGNIDDDLIFKYLKNIGTPMALNLMNNCKKIDVLLKKAEKLFDACKYKEALVQTDNALAVDRTNWFISLVRGEIYFALGNYIQSINDYTVAINLVSPILPYTGILYFKRAMAYQSLGNMYAAKSDCLMAASFNNANAAQMLLVQGWA